MKTCLFLFCLLLFKTAFAEVTQIVQIRDSNLFELKDGHLVCLANVKTPSVFTADSNNIYLARFIKKYAEAEYLNRPVSIEYSGEKDSDGYPFVHIFLHFPLETIHINAVYLKRGFGRYVDSARDTTYRQDYKAAAFYAKKKRLGIWNLRSFKAKDYSGYALSLFYGYAKPRDTYYKTSFGEVLLRFAPAKEISGLEARASVFFKREKGRICCECGGSEYISPYRTETSIGYSISGILHRTFKWAGFSFGMTYLNVRDWFCSEGPDFWVIPSATVKAGWMEKIYFSASLWNYFRLSEYTVGINYIFSNPLNRLWIGIGSYADFQNRAFQLDYNIFENYLLHIQGGCLLKGKTEIYGRIGFGFILH